MKFSRSPAFTLIELLVVIAIIIVLAGMIFAVGPAVIDRGNKVQASSDLAQIVTAAKAYYTDYGSYPMNDRQTTTLTPSDTVFGDPNGTYSNKVLFDGLRAITTTFDPKSQRDWVPNPRAIIYIEPRNAKDSSKPKNGICVSGANQGRWYDPWGSEYMVFLDGDYDGVINMPLFSTIYQSTEPPPRVGVGVASLGKDQHPGKKGGSNDYVGSDDIVSWR